MLQDKQEILSLLQETNSCILRFTRDDYTFQYYLELPDGLREVSGGAVRSLVYKGFLELVYLKDHNKNKYVLKETKSV